MKPPRLFQAVLSRALPAELRETTLADIQEMFAKRVERHGAFRARMWYRVQAVSFVARFAFERPSFSLLDWKLGFRMLFKYPGLSIVGGLALATSIGFGAGFFQMISQSINPDLGLDEGHRIVVLDRYDPRERTAHPIPVSELMTWREKLTNVVELSAYRSLARSLVDQSGISRPVLVAEITPSAFPLTRVPPLRGRALDEGDAQAGAEDVIVIGYDLWQSRLGADPEIIGRNVHVGRVVYRVVGVMPQGFGFPLSHNAWIPLRLSSTADTRTTLTFARLAPGASMESAQAELTAVGEGTLVAEVSGDAPLVTRVTHFGAPDPAGDDNAAAIFGNLLMILLLAAASANVATLVFARTAMRESEIVVRNALGASRGRIMGQLLVESLVLSSVAAAVGLVGANAVLRYVFYNTVVVQQRPVPFWWKAGLGPAAILYAGGLAVLGAAMVALLPALKVTGARVSESLKNASAGTSLSFGGVWSVIIILQVAITVIALPFGVEYAQGVWQRYQVRASFPSDGYLTFQMQVDPRAGVAAWGDGAPGVSGVPSGGGVARIESDPEHRAFVTTVYGELDRQLREEPGVESVTFADALPGMRQSGGPIEVAPRQAGASASVGVEATSTNPNPWAEDASIAVGFFETFGVPVVEGRPFNNGDIGAPNPPILINESLAREIGRGAGSRLRMWSSSNEPGPWLDVVGVVRDVGADPDDLGREYSFIYRPVAPGDLNALIVAVRTKGDPEALIPRLREVAARVDPGIRLTEVQPLTDVLRGRDWPDVLASLSGAGGIFICVLLSAAGLFALMAVAVARRTREVGIRLALGASRAGILTALFRRAAEQLAAGIVVGGLSVFLILEVFDDSRGVALLPLFEVAGVMLLVGLIACAAPARRALRIKPVEALREG